MGEVQYNSETLSNGRTVSLGQEVVWVWELRILTSALNCLRVASGRHLSVSRRGLEHFERDN